MSDLGLTQEDKNYLPSSWAVTVYADIYLSASNGIGGKQNKDELGIPVSRIETIADEVLNFNRIGYIEKYDLDKIDKYELQAGDILFSHINSPKHLGKTAIVENTEKLYHGINLLRIVVNGSLVVPRIFNYHCKYLRNNSVFSMNAQHAVNQSSLNQTKLGAFEFPLPPLAEQKVIADKLDELLAQVESTKARLDAIPAILKSFRQSVLAAAVSGKLTEEWRGEKTKLPNSEMLLTLIKKERFESWVSHELEKKKAKGIKPKDDKWKDKYPEPLSNYSDPLQRTRIDEIPENWLKTNLDTVSILTTGKTPSTTNEANWNGELPFISPAQVHKNGHILEPVRYVSELGSKTVPVVVKNSILIVCIGTVGKVGVLDSDAVINQQLNAITPLPMVLSRYMFYWSKNLYPWIIETSRATVNAAIINKSRLSEAPFALPSLEEQTEIVRRVEELFAFANKVEAQVNAAQARVNNLTQSILAKAFRGELTADWRAANPELISGDNSAEALLKRIKAERTKLKSTKKTKA